MPNALGRYDERHSVSDNDQHKHDPFEMVRKIESRGPAPVHLWDPPFCGDMDMLIRKDGSWVHEGQPIRRIAMVKLFASVLKREESDYYLVTPVEKVRIQVEDCPFIVQQMDVSGEGEQQNLKFTTSLEESVTADEIHCLVFDCDPVSGEPHPRIHLRSGLEALINRAVFYRLVELAVERESTSGELELGVFSGGKFFSLGLTSAPDNHG